MAGEFGRRDAAACVEALLGAGADVHAATFMNKTALYYAAEKGFAEIASILLERGGRSDLLRETTYGTTPMYIASRNQNRAVEAVLVEAATKKTKKKGGLVNGAARTGARVGAGARGQIRGDNTMLFSDEYLDRRH